MKLKRLLCAASCAAFCLSLAGCVISAPQTVLTVDGEAIPAGLYLSYQYSAYTEAASQLSSNETLEDATIDDVPADEWVHNRTIELIRQHVYVERAFEEQGLTIPEAEAASAQSTADQYYDENEDLIAANGIGKESYRTFYMSQVKYNALLQAYLEEHRSEVTVDEAKGYMDTTYAHIMQLTLPSTDASYQLLDEDAAAALMEAANNAIAQMEDEGATLDEVADDVLQEVLPLSGREYTDSSVSEYLSERYVSENSTLYGNDFSLAMLAAEVGSCGLYTASTSPLLYEKLPNYETDQQFEEEHFAAMADEINARAFEEEVDEKAGALSLEEDAAAVRTYSVYNIKTEVRAPPHRRGAVSYPACSRKRGFYADIVYHRPGRHTAWGGRARLCRKRAHSGAHAAAGAAPHRGHGPLARHGGAAFAGPAHHAAGRADDRHYFIRPACPPHHWHPVPFCTKRCRHVRRAAARRGRSAGLQCKGRPAVCVLQTGVLPL